MKLNKELIFSFIENSKFTTNLIQKIDFVIIKANVIIINFIIMQITFKLYEIAHVLIKFFIMVKFKIEPFMILELVILQS